MYVCQNWLLLSFLLLFCMLPTTIARLQSIAIVAYNRPEYLKEVLNSLKHARGIDRFDVRCYVDPSPLTEDVVGLCETFLAKHRKSYSLFEKDYSAVVVNPVRFGCHPNKYSSAQKSFEDIPNLDFLVVLEDDVVLAPDALEYFEWARHEYRDSTEVFSVSAYSDLCHLGLARQQTSLACVNPDRTRSNSVLRRRHFTPWAWATWKDRWEQDIGPFWSGWDSTMNFALALDWVEETSLFEWVPNSTTYGKGLRGTRFEIFPVLSRANNIGIERGVHSMVKNENNDGLGVDDFDSLFLWAKEYTRHDKSPFRELEEGDTIARECSMAAPKSIRQTPWVELCGSCTAKGANVCGKDTTYAGRDETFERPDVDRLWLHGGASYVAGTLKSMGRIDESVATLDSALKSAIASEMSTLERVTTRELRVLLMTMDAKTDQEVLDASYLVMQSLISDLEQHLLRDSGDIRVEGRFDDAMIRTQLARTIYNTALIEYRLGRYDKAVRAFERSVNLDSSRADVWYGLGLASQRVDRPEKAAKSYRRALELDPGHVSSVMNLDVALSDAGLVPLSISILRYFLSSGAFEGDAFKKVREKLHKRERELLQLHEQERRGWIATTLRAFQERARISLDEGDVALADAVNALAVLGESELAVRVRSEWEAWKGRAAQGIRERGRQGRQGEL
eukprot:g1820.t1